MDARVTMRKGEILPVYVQKSISSGTLLITGSPTVSLYDSTGALVISGASVSGYDNTAAADVRVWYLLDTSALSAGTYSLVFSFSADGSDGLSRSFVEDVQVQVTGVTD